MSLDVRMSVSFTGAVKFSFSTCVLHEPARDQASPCTAKPRLWMGQETLTWHPGLCHARIRDGQSEDARVSRFDVEKISDLGIEYDIVSKLVGAVQRMNMNDKTYKASLGPRWRGESSNAQLQLAASVEQ